MTTIYEVPLSGKPQKFSIQLGDISYKLTLHYADAVDGGWLLDIADVNDVPLANGLPLVTGYDILEQYSYLGIAGNLVVQSDGNDIYAVPTFDDLGTSSHLYFVTA